MPLDPSPVTPVWRVPPGPPPPDQALAERTRLALSAAVVLIPSIGKQLLLALFSVRGAWAPGIAILVGGPGRGR